MELFQIGTVCTSSEFVLKSQLLGEHYQVEFIWKQSKWFCLRAWFYDTFLNMSSGIFAYEITIFKVITKR